MALKERNGSLRRPLRVALAVFFVLIQLMVALQQKQFKEAFATLGNAALGEMDAIAPHLPLERLASGREGVVPHNDPNGTQEKDRHMAISEGLDSPTKIKIVAFTDGEYLQTGKWWYDRMTRLGYTEHRLIAIDQNALAGLNGTEYRHEFVPVDPGTRRKNMVRSLWYHRVAYCLEQLKQNTSLLLTDVDNIFTRYVPLAEFQRSGFDVIHAYEMRFPVQIFEKQGFTVCGGMTWMTSTNRTVAFMEMLREACDGGTKRCDDQVELNKLMYNTLNMAWDETPETHGPTAQRVNSTDSNSGLLEVGMTGVSAVTGHRVKIWDRDFAWRGPYETERCPSVEKNWVAMPGPFPNSIISEFGLKTRDKEKKARVAVWDKYCGKGGTNHRRRAEEKNGDALEPLRRAFRELNLK